MIKMWTSNCGEKREMEREKRVLGREKKNEGKVKQDGRRCSSRVSLPGRIGNSIAVKVKAREERKGEEGLCRLGRLVHDGRPNVRTRTNLPTRSISLSRYVLRNLHLRTTCDNNALVLVDQVGL